MAPVRDVAKVIIQKSSGPISNLKLQKLLYYVQGWHLGLKGTPVFGDPIQAWVHGPVVPEIFQRYRHHRWNPIDMPTTDAVVADPYAKHIDAVLKVYGKYTADQLERLSHTEKPWLDARGDLPASAPSNAEITVRSMREFFARKAKAQA